MTRDICYNKGNTTNSYKGGSYMTYGDKISTLYSGVGRNHQNNTKEERSKWNIAEGNTLRTYNGVVKVKKTLLKSVLDKRGK